MKISLDICPWTYLFFLAHSFLVVRSLKTVCFSEQVMYMYADEYASIFLRQMEAIVYNIVSWTSYLSLPSLVRD